MNPYTYGNTPAAIYLADQLNNINDARFSKRIGAIINQNRAVLKQIMVAHDEGHVDRKTVMFVVNAVHIKIDALAECMKEINIMGDFIESPENLAIDLMSNIVKGEIKKITRRAFAVGVKCTNQTRELGKLKDIVSTSFDIIPKQFKLCHEQDHKNANYLIKRSIAKLNRLNKPITLYKNV